MPQQKITRLSHVTLEPSLLFGKRDAIATKGRVYAMAHSVLRVDGKDYAQTDGAVSSDLNLPHLAIADAGCKLFEAVAQQIADETQTTVEYLVNGEVRSVAPAAK